MIHRLKLDILLAKRQQNVLCFFYGITKGLQGFPVGEVHLPITPYLSIIEPDITTRLALG